MTSSDYEGEFITNYYTIQINILYDRNSADTSDLKSDDVDDSVSKYYIINNMKDILLDEFRSKTKYNSFKKIYDTKDKITPLYIVNDSYYIDKYVMEAIGKITTNNFPSYSSNTTIPIEQEVFKKNYEKFISNSNIEHYKDLLFKIFKEVCLKSLRPQTKQNELAELIRESNITTLESLYAQELFIEATGNRTFYTLIKQIYETSLNANLKKALQLFYNIPNNKLSNISKYEYFLNPETITSIFKVIDENSSTTSERSYYNERPSLNTNKRKEAIYKEFYKYVFPNKKDETSLNDPDKDKILMFYNIYYIIQNIYLTDDTIINITSYRAKKTNDKKKYYVSQVRLLDLKDNTTHFKIEEKKVTIFLKATLKYIVENPILQINYLIDNLENARQDFLPQSYILEPKDLNSEYSNSKDNKIYIHDKVKYVDNIYGIESVIIDSRKYNYIKNKEELFFNTNALKLFNNYFKTKINSEIVTTIKEQIVESNIKYLLHKIFLFYNNKVFKKYYIADTYIQYFDTSSNYFSITKGDVVEKSEKYKIISKLLKDSLSSEPEVEQTTALVPAKSSKSIFKLFESTDARLEDNKIYKINLIFRCFSDKSGKKPTIVRKLVAENCLSKAQQLDEAFTNTLYKAFRLPENYLYNKLANITSKQKPKTAPENKTNPVAPQQKLPNKRGGNITKKYNHNKNKNIRLKYNIIYQ